MFPAKVIIISQSLRTVFRLCSADEQPVPRDGGIQRLGAVSSHKVVCMVTFPRPAVRFQLPTICPSQRMTGWKIP